MNPAIAMMVCLVSAPDAQTIDDSSPKIVLGGAVLSMEGEVVTIAFDAYPDADMPEARTDSADGRWVQVFRSAAAARLDREETERMIGRRAEFTLRRTVSGRLVVVAWRRTKLPAQDELASIRSP
jgi:hypothetical protein